MNYGVGVVKFENVHKTRRTITVNGFTYSAVDPNQISRIPVLITGSDTVSGCSDCSLNTCGTEACAKLTLNSVADIEGSKIYFKKSCTVMLKAKKLLYNTFYSRPPMGVSGWICFNAKEGQSVDIYTLTIGSIEWRIHKVDFSDAIDINASFALQPVKSVPSTKVDYRILNSKIIIYKIYPENINPVLATYYCLGEKYIIKDWIFAERGKPVIIDKEGIISGKYTGADTFYHMNSAPKQINGFAVTTLLAAVAFFVTKTGKWIQGNDFKNFKFDKEFVCASSWRGVSVKLNRHIISCGV